MIALFQSRKLTKKLLMELSEGLYLVSNCLRTTTESILAETVQPSPQRQTQWRRIVAVGAKGRLCHIFPSPQAAQTHFANLAGTRFDPAWN